MTINIVRRGEKLLCDVKNRTLLNLLGIIIILYTRKKASRNKINIKRIEKTIALRGVSRKFIRLIYSLINDSVLTRKSLKRRDSVSIKTLRRKQN